MPFKFEKLEIWELAIDMAEGIHNLTRGFPKEEMFSLTSQMKRAADSVVLNIAEGSTGQSVPEYKRFLGISLRSAIEVVSCLFISKARNYINDTEFKRFYNEYEILCKMITKLKQSM